MFEFIQQMLESVTYWNVALLMFIENIFPPIPSEVVMPVAGAAARRGEISFMGVILAGSVGALLGSLPWYGLARWVGTDHLLKWVEKHGHWFGTDVEEIQRADAWFDKHGKWAVFFGRLVPGVRTVISIPAGFSEMPLVQFVTYSIVGVITWTAILAGTGYWLEGINETFSTILQWIGAAVVLVLLIWFVRRVIKKRSQNEVGNL